MHLAELGDAQRQIAIAFQAVLEDLNVAGAVHRLAAEHALVRSFGDEHVLAELLPVAGLLPEFPLHHVGRVHLDIAVGLLAAAHVADQRLKHRPALRMPEHGAGGFLLKMEQIHLAPEPPVIALLGLLKLMEIGRKLLLGGPGGAVDALQMLATLVGAPI